MQASAGWLVRFVADAPTATMQRVKALTTGGLPTFFDISRSFTAAELAEDNLIDQLHRHGFRMVRPDTPVFCCAALRHSAGI